MPVHNFMLADLAGCLLAVCLFPLFVIVPGYAIAWLLDLFEFRGRRAAFRLALSLVLSISLCPILTYLTGRFGSMTAVKGLYLAALVYLIIVFALRWRWRLPRRAGVWREYAVFAAIVAVWLMVSILSMIDIQSGDRLYYPASALDQAVHTPFVHAIPLTGIPPQNPLYYPGHGVPLRYHYFWYMMCGLVDLAGTSAVSGRQALVAGTFWCGIGLMALVALYLRLFAAGDPARFRRRCLTGILLLGITGLDIAPTLFLLFLYSRRAIEVILPSVEWWNEHVDSFIYTATWSPHSLAALIAGLTAFLLLWRAPTARGAGGLIRYVVLAAAALASSIGSSIYVAFVFAVFLTVWTAVTLWKRWFRETAGLVLAGLTCVVISHPYLVSLRGPETGGAPPLQFTVRAFSFARMVPGWRSMREWQRLFLFNLPLLPANYLLELGFFFLVGCLVARQYIRRNRPLERHELAAAIMAATSILICTFLRSSVIDNNDLGWRGFLVAQFVLVVWAVDLLAGWKRPDLLPPGRKSLIAVFIALGAAGTVYDQAIQRFYPMLSDRRLVPRIDWMTPDRELGRRTFANRAAYEWLRGAIPQTATLQFNPKIIQQDTPALMYSDRRIVAGDEGCMTGFGGDPRTCPPIMSRLKEIYPAPGRPAAQSLQEVCGNLPIDVIVAKDIDTAWADRSSWVWHQEPIFANRYIRLFRCPQAAPTADR